MEKFKRHPIAFLLIYTIGKVLGLVWVFVAIPFRGYARSVVYNYTLQNKRTIKRLADRMPARTSEGWVLRDVHGLRERHDIRGFIRDRKVSRVEYYIVVFLLWGWLDDDSNEDTTDKGYIRSLTHGDGGFFGDNRSSIKAKLLGRWMRDIDWNKVLYGNTFDLGDVRSQHPFCNWAATFAWNSRNTAMNFKYMFLDY